MPGWGSPASGEGPKFKGDDNIVHRSIKSHRGANDAPQRPATAIHPGEPPRPRVTATVGTHAVVGSRNQSIDPTDAISIDPPYSNEKPDTTVDREDDRMITCTQSIIDRRPDARQEITVEIRGE